MVGIQNKVKRNKGGNPNWKPGVSANPGGRPAVAREFKARCQDFMESEGWDILIEIAKDKKDRDRQAALTLVAAYAYGKPTQHTEADVTLKANIQAELELQDTETLKEFREWQRRRNGIQGQGSATEGTTGVGSTKA